ncbi:hypothetical protein PAXINDRAFT_19274 [Paxillus involutus ATCC 200175]|uniref:Uncharacterized protein n=1 Tax=Paxillus involutus ATCC 200175 TaxID=664439 RepID=A0A0C9SN96_PAXIN|nr:hypothetical protein PAXINDRAFT_19274 [Paxillus involutus ATCC 200175]
MNPGPALDASRHNNDHANRTGKTVRDPVDSCDRRSAFAGECDVSVARCRSDKTHFKVICTKETPIQIHCDRRNAPYRERGLDPCRIIWVFISLGRFLITGIPLHNSLEQFFALVKFISHEVFSDYAHLYFPHHDDAGAASKRDGDAANAGAIATRLTSSQVPESDMAFLPQSSVQKLCPRYSARPTAMIQSAASKDELLDMVEHEAEKTVNLSDDQAVGGCIHDAIKYCP